MIKLSNQEKKLALIKYIIHGNSPFAQLPIEKRVEMLNAAATKIGLGYDEAEFMAIGEACLEFQAEVNEHLKQFVNKNTDMVIKSHDELQKGNEAITKIVGEDIVKKGLSLFRRGKVDD